MSDKFQTGSRDPKSLIISYGSLIYLFWNLNVALCISEAMGSLVVRAPDYGPEGLGLMSVPPNTLREHTEHVLVKSVDPKVMWAESRVQETGENFHPPQFHA
ncbi:hypothetical protein TNCV_4747101 [Trichonephila clavipes]|nr:hypothetical protein TNCV_4747101 [Trichonephila clavipes]